MKKLNLNNKDVAAAIDSICGFCNSPSIVKYRRGKINCYISNWTFEYSYWTILSKRQIIRRMRKMEKNNERIYTSYHKRYNFKWI